MTKLESIEHKIFASEAPLDEIGQFGSALDTTKLNTKDVTTIQALPAYTKGWGSAVVSDSNYPTMEEMNGVLNVMSYHTGYLYQEGMPAWRSDREYSATSIVKEPTGTKFFRSLKDGNIGNTLDNTEYWEELKFGGSGLELCDTDIVIRDDEKMFNQLQQMRHSTFDKSKFTVVGSPTITDDGIASGFSNSSYLTTTTLLLSGNFEIYGNFKLGSYFDSGLPFGLLGSSGLPVRFQLKNSGTGFYFYYNNTWINNTTFVWELNTEYSFKVSYINSKLNLYLSKVNQQLVKYTNDISDWEHYDVTGVRFGFVDHKAFKGSIDLSHFSITVDGKEVFSGNKTGLDVIKPDNYEVVGSPVISDDGVASGFSAGNYVSLPFTLANITKNSNSWEVILPFKTGQLSTIDGKFILSSNGTWSNILETWDGGKLRLSLTSNGTSYDIANYVLGNYKLLENTQYYIKLKFTGNNYIVEYSLNGKDYIEDINIVSNLPLKDKNLITTLGYYINAVNRSWPGSIDLNAFKIYVDGNLVYQPCLKIPYTESKTGSKIVDVAYRDRVIDLYEQEGQAGYYTIDEPNQNFTLPMGEIYGMIEQKGTYQPPLLSTMWSDHLLNNMSWLRADTFSWQDGTTYSQAYNELLAEYNDSASVEETEGSITFKRTPKGYKIALETQETAIAEKYTTDGIAWYYILDTANKKFKLPRAKHPSLVTLTSNAPVVGNGITLGFTDGHNNFGLAPSGNTENTWQYRTGNYGLSLPNNIGRNVGNTPGDANCLGITTDPEKSGLVADLSNNVKDYNMYLYFYVGAFTKSAEAQTAGLNSELFNGKVDKSDLSEIYPVVKTYVNGTSGYRIWSDGYCVQCGRSTVNQDSSVTITFLKPFMDTSYYANWISCSGTNTSGSGTRSADTLTTTTMRLFNGQDVTMVANWQASGYLAEGWNNEGI